MHRDAQTRRLIFSVVLAELPIELCAAAMRRAICPPYFLYMGADGLK